MKDRETRENSVNKHPSFTHARAPSKGSTFIKRARLTCPLDLLGGLSSSVSRHPFSCKSHACSCRWGHLGLQVARRRGFTGLEAALQFAGFFGLAQRLRLFGAMPIPSHSGLSPWRLLNLQLHAHIRLSYAGTFGSPQNHRAKAALAR